MNSIITFKQLKTIRSILLLSGLDNVLTHFSQSKAQIFGIHDGMKNLSDITPNSIVCVNSAPTLCHHPDLVKILSNASVIILSKDTQIKSFVNSKKVSQLIQISEDDKEKIYLNRDSHDLLVQSKFLLDDYNVVIDSTQPEPSSPNLSVSELVKNTTQIIKMNEPAAENDILDEQDPPDDKGYNAESESEVDDPEVNYIDIPTIQAFVSHLGEKHKINLSYSTPSDLRDITNAVINVNDCPQCAKYRWPLLRAISVSGLDDHAPLFEKTVSYYSHKYFSGIPKMFKIDVALKDPSNLSFQLVELTLFHFLKLVKPKTQLFLKYGYHSRYEVPEMRQTYKYDQLFILERSPISYKDYINAAMKSLNEFERCDVLLELLC